MLALFPLRRPMAPGFRTWQKDACQISDRWAYSLIRRRRPPPARDGQWVYPAGATPGAFPGLEVFRQPASFVFVKGGDQRLVLSVKRRQRFSIFFRREIQGNLGPHGRRKRRKQLVIVALRNRIEFMVVAAGAA